MSKTEQGSIAVVAAVICREDRFLIGKRQGGERHGGLWEFPGGKLEAGETHQQAAARELKEELAVAMTQFGPHLITLRDPASPYVLDFFAVEIAGMPHCLEHSALAWHTLAEMLTMPLAPGDRAFVQSRFGTASPAPKS